MLTILVSLMLFTSATPVHPMCATVNNMTNTATWVSSTRTSTRTSTAHYTDNNGLHFDRPVVPVVMIAVAKLQLGAPGPKITHACVLLR